VIELVTPVQKDFVAAMTKQNLDGQENSRQGKITGSQYNALYK